MRYVAICSVVFFAVAGRALGDDPKQLPKELKVDLGKGVALELVLVPAGEFMMGSPQSNNDANDREKPQHRVRITKPFYLGKYLVTQEQWETTMGTNGSHFKIRRTPWNKSVGTIASSSSPSSTRNRRPRPGPRVLGAPASSGCQASAVGICLPPGSTTRFCFGDEEKDLGDYAWYKGNSGKELHTHPVGEKKPNAWGLYDMHGNIFEWCQDWLDDGYYAKSPTDDPAGPEKGSTGTDRAECRVYRGGAKGSPPNICRSAYRACGSPGVQMPFLGFRVALTPTE